MPSLILRWREVRLGSLRNNEVGMSKHMQYVGDHCSKNVLTGYMVCNFHIVAYCFVFQGKVHLELRLSEVITDTGVICHKLATR